MLDDMARLSWVAAAGLGAALLLGSAAPAQAFSSRIHIMVANKVREALIANGGASVPLWQGGHAVELSEDDARAIVEQPEAFRAGAIGPDNMMFPGMTDPSHAVRQRPYEQCERLYEAAVLDRERAYAMGCFLHGATDAVAHHYVNYMTGETFTLNPITSGRQQSFANVVRHVVSEQMIQKAAYAQDPGAFGGAALSHDIPKPFLLRTYFDTKSPVYALMGKHALDELDATWSANPNDTLLEIMFELDVAPADHLILAPTYIGEIQAIRAWLRTYLESELADMQDWSTAQGSELQILPGNDGVLGTKDDDALCSVSCPSLFAKYFLFAGLLAPRYDANGNELPPAWDKVSDKLGGDLDDFSPAFVDVIDNLSHRLNAPLDAGGGGLEDLDWVEIQGDFQPLNDWADRITTVDYQSIAVSVTPAWMLEMSAFFQSFGIDVDLVAWIEALLEPVIEPIRDGIRAFVVDEAEVFLADLADEYAATEAATEAEYTARLAQSMPPELGGGTPLDHFYDTGLYIHSFNITAAALGSHAVILPVGEDPVGVGPASFDASHTQSWMQAGVCAHLRREVFPLGIDVAGALSVWTDAQHLAVVAGDAPIECHDGSLFQFASAPSKETCFLTTLDQVISDPHGTVTRAHPPELGSQPVECLGVVVPGLPGPTEGEGGAGGSSAGPSGKNRVTVTTEESCGCRVAGGRPAPAPRPGRGALALVALVARRRRRSGSRRTWRRAAAVGSLGLGLSGCGVDGEAPAGATSSAGGGAGGEGGAATTSTTTSSGTTSTTTTGGGGSKADELLAAIDDTVWHGLQTRQGKTRAYEQWFDADTKRWAELRNPFGPSRHDVLREFVVHADGVTVEAVDDADGSVTSWSIEVLPGSPRTLRITDDNGAAEEFAEGITPEPALGLTAEVRVFQANGAVANAYCKAGGCGIDYATLFAFARGGGAESDLGRDIVAGARLLSWYNVPNFGITDVGGFDFGTLGGTELSDQYNFIVRYTGWIEHPGGVFTMRERDDDVGELNPTDYGGVWVFLGNDVGAGGFADLFLGVNAFAFCSDGSADEPGASAGPGYVPVEIIMIRCNTDGPPVDVELAFEGEPYDYVGNQPTAPDTSVTLFPLGL